MLNYEEAGWQSFTFLKWVSLSKSHMGAAIMRFINRLNIQTSWLKKKKKTCVQFQSWQQDPSQLGTRRFSGMGSWIYDNCTCTVRTLPLPGNDDSFWSRSRQILSPSYPTKVTTASGHRQLWKSWFLALSSLKGVETGGQTPKNKVHNRTQS